MMRASTLQTHPEPRGTWSCCRRSVRVSTLQHSFSGFTYHFRLFGHLSLQVFASLVLLPLESNFYRSFTEPAFLIGFV